MKILTTNLKRTFIIMMLSVALLPTVAHAQFFGGDGERQLPDIVSLVDKHGPAVVNISTTTKAKPAPQGPMGQMPMPFGGTPFEDFFKDFFEQMPQQQTRPAQSLGSGVIISADGYVVTNHHVVNQADDILVRLSDESEFAAELVGADSKNDLALLKIDAPQKFEYVSLGDSDKVKVGQWVVAIGNPFGLGGTVTTGIISARGRHIGAGPYDDFFQTDAAINPGNSGGPLFSLNGEIIGINTAILSRSGGNQGIGFSIPSNIVKNIVEQIKEHGRPIRGWLGVRIQKVTKDMASALGLDESKGALVAEVEPDSPADKAGLKVGDVIMSYDGENINEINDLPKLVAQTSVGAKAKMTVLRDGNMAQLTAKIAELEEEDMPSMAGKEEADTGSLGLRLTNLTDSARQRFGIDKSTEGALVQDVERGSTAARSGIRPGDVVVRIGKTVVDSASEAQKAIAGEKGGTVLLLVNRQGSNMFVPVRRTQDDG
mgnify:CR=1 FL=1